MKRLFPVLFSVIFLAACFNKTPLDILPKEKIIQVLTDIHLVDGYIGTAIGSAANEQELMYVLYKSVFKKYNTDSAGFARSLKYYSGQPKDLKDIYAQVKKNIDKIAKYEQKLSDEERRKNEISFKKQKEKLHRDSLKLAVSKKEKATLDSIMKFSVKRRKPLLDSLNKKKIERLRADFRKYHRIYLPWKEFKVPAPVKKTK